MTEAAVDVVWQGADALRPFLVAIDSLEPFPGNPRRGDVAVIRASLRRFGQVRPILVDGERIIAGHHLRLAAKEEGWTHVAATPNDFENEEEARAYLVTDNRTAEVGGFDEPLLMQQLNAVRETSAGLEGTGYSERDYDQLRASVERASAAEAPGADDAPAVPVEPESQLGEVYELGPHRLLCGDARDAEQVAALLAGETAEVLWTDPPYGVSYVGKTRDALTIQNDDEDGLPELLEKAFRAADAVLAPSARFYIAAPAGPQGTAFRHAIDSIGWRFHEALVWVKNVMVLGHSDYHFQHEDVLYGWKRGPGRPGRGAHEGSRWYGDNSQTSVFFVDRPSRSSEHPTMKPVDLIVQMLRNSSRPGEIVFDPFAGSGSTMIAAEHLGRRCFAVELDRGYCDVIRRRYAEFAEAKDNLAWSASRVGAENVT